MPVEKPEYHAFRAAVDRIYPAHKHLIALSRHVTERDARKAKQDLEEQITPAILAAYGAEKLDEMVGHLHVRATDGRAVGMPFTNVMYPFYPSEEDDTDIKDKSFLNRPASFIYIALNPKLFAPRQRFHTLSSGDIPALHMKFNQAALNPNMDRWFTFFHELCHAAIRLQAHDYFGPHLQDQTELDYYASMEESVCDAYAAINLLKLYGDGTLPFLKTYADMRQSRFYQLGHEYYCGPALYKIIEDYKDGNLTKPFEDINTLFDMAVRTAEQTYVERQGFEKSYKTIEELRNAEPLLWLFQGGYLRGCITREIHNAYSYHEVEDQKLAPKQREMQESLYKSLTILFNEYQENKWTARWNGLKRAVKRPLHKLGLAEHPGY
ncbi:MAG: hypothetical protein H6867_01365 [Rhodospirillales bacterium]|nr:hypothetical protein [Rhodospirillales bacterium]MCB9997165.1 hypothetical protein [Rhodospirillales bacterium]